MAKKEKKFGAAKRFGARYGRKLKHKFVAIEAEKNKKHECPSCHWARVKRLAAGIWTCTKCKLTFAGKAYTVRKKIIVTEAVTKEEIVVPDYIEEFEPPKAPPKVEETEPVQEAVEQTEELQPEEEVQA